MPRLRIGVIFGGRSAEHEVSLVSATGVMRALDPRKYVVVPIGIAPNGRWLSGPRALKLLKEGSPLRDIPEHLLLPDPRKRGLEPVNGASGRKPLDVVFPVLHGTFGEDGSIQGLFELADIPYVGAGVLGSAVGMDKVVQKQLLRQAGIPVTTAIWFTAVEYRRQRSNCLAAIEGTLKHPVFVKPPNAGSSVGISKAHNRRELLKAIRLALQYDRKVLVEQAVPYAREIEVSVLGNDEPIASMPGEIIPSNEFYDYDAKYVDGKSRAEIPAKLNAAVVRKVRELAVRAFKALDGSGMARVDFLVNRRTNEVYLNEINTIPGFTPISMYPKLWEASGLSYSQVLDRLIALALERHKQTRRLKTTFRPKNAWYRN
jgi:D-alanine-D-alanine ligase